MNMTEYLLTKINEEALEVAHRATKALRFGLDEVQPGQEADNAQRMIGEYMQLVASLQMLEMHTERSLIPRGSLREAMVDAAIAKTQEFMNYSRQLGTLTDGETDQAYPLLRKLAQATLDAHESLFSQCCSNPIMNSWGNRVDTTLLNQAAEIAREATEYPNKP